MPSDNKPSNDALVGQEACVYQPPHRRSSVDNGQCRCAPQIALQRCHCTASSNPWSRRRTLFGFSKPSRQVGLIAYVRTGDGMTEEKQLKLIQDYCSAHGYYVMKVFKDDGKPSFALEEALQAIDGAGGMIAANLDRFVSHSTDRLRDLRPFVHHFFCHTAKHLISVEEGIDTSSPEGQIYAIELISSTKEGL